MRSSLVRIIAVIAMLGLALVLIFSELADSRGRIDQATRMVEAQGNAIAEIVGESSRHGLEVFTRWKTEQENHLIDNANWLAWVDTQRRLSESDLDKFASDLGLWRIMYFGPDGQIQKSNLPEGAGRRSQGDLPASFLDPLVSGREKTGILGLRQARIDGQPRHVAGVTRPGGGAVVVSTRAGDLDLARIELAPGHLIRSLANAHGLYYVALQDRQGVIASSTTEVGFTLPGDDADLQPLTEGRAYVTRRFESSLGPILEVARILELRSDEAPDKAVLLRVGLDAGLLVELEKDAHRRSLLRILLTAGSLVLISVILLAWQRQAVLKREVAKVTTALARKEEEARRREKLVAMGNLAAGVAHEIRNPLNTIHMIAQNLGRTQGLESRWQDQADQIRDESGRIESIVQQFLDFARPREPVMAPLELGEVVHSAVAVMQSAQAGDNLEITFSGQQPVHAVLDREMVLQIVDNLVRNAVEAQPEGGRVVVNLETEGKEAVLKVADAGSGIAPDDRSRIFDLYFTTRPEGTGVGLSLVSRMVSAMDGTLTLAESTNDLPGAHFEIRFPLARR